MVSCSKEELATGNQGNESDDEMVYVDVTASMPECQDPVSRTEVDGLGESNISLKWSAADTKAYGMTIYQKEGAYVMGNPSFNATPSADEKTLSFIAGFNNPKKAYLVYPQLPKDNSNNTMTFALDYNQSKSTFSKNNYCCPIKILLSYKNRADFICEVSPFSLDFCRQTKLI